MLLLLFQIFITLMVLRIATVALTFTGLSRDVARLQARSAFCTVGFTTAESESVVNHPVRRRIVGVLMLMGYIGFVGITATSLTSILSIQNTEKPDEQVHQILILGLGLLFFFLIATSKWLDNQLFRIIGWALRRWTHLHIQDYSSLLELEEGYSVSSINLSVGDWPVGKRLDQLRFNSIGINVLGVRRTDGTFVGAPEGGTYLRRGDKMTVYGARESVALIDKEKSNPGHALRHFAYLERVDAARAEHGEKLSGAALTETTLYEKDWACGRSLREVLEGGPLEIMMGLYRANGDYDDNPDPDTIVGAGDRVVLFGTRQSSVIMQYGPKDAPRIKTDDRYKTQG